MSNENAMRSALLLLCDDGGKCEVRGAMKYEVLWNAVICRRAALAAELTLNVGGGAVQGLDRWLRTKE